MIQIKALHTMEKCHFKTKIHLCYPLALNRNKQLQNYNTVNSLILAFFLLASFLKVRKCALRNSTLFTQKLLPL